MSTAYPAVVRVQFSHDRTEVYEVRGAKATTRIAPTPIISATPCGLFLERLAQ